jgi:hypothetical protein
MRRAHVLGVNSFNVLELFVLGLSCTFLVPMLFALIDALKTPADVWQRANQQQIVWVVVILVGGFFGAVLYWLIPRKALREAKR